MKKIAIDLSLVFLLTLLPDITACPDYCTCSQSSTGMAVTCLGGAINSIVAALPQNTMRLKLVSPSTSGTLQNSYFNSLSATQMTSLTISKTALTSIQENTFSRLQDLQELDLSGNNIDTINPKAFLNLQNLKKLNISTNSIKKIGDLFSSLQSLTDLDLGRNYINEIKMGNFRDLASLSVLKLDGNKLSNLHGYVFQGLQNLKHLSLRNCQMTDIANDLFSIVRNLETLDLGVNKIKELPDSEKLKNLPYLRTLLLDSNHLHSLKDQQFSGMKLSNLNLSKNKLSLITKDTFKYFNVRHLDLSYNKISDIEDDALRPTAPHLEMLNLAGNPISGIPSNAFQGLYRLEALNLSACALEILQEDQFSSMIENLKSLDLSWNNLHYLPEPVINVFNSLETIYIHGNFWNCDCKIKPLYNWLNDPHSSDKIFCPQSAAMNSKNCMEPKCATPQSVSRQSIVLLTESQVHNCNFEESGGGLDAIQATILATCLFLLVILIGVIYLVYRRAKSKNALKLCGGGSEDSREKRFDEKKRRPFAYDGDTFSLNVSDKSFVMKKYLHTMTPDAGGASVITPIREYDSQYASQTSLSSSESTVFARLGKESAV